MARKLTQMSWEDIQKEMSIAGSPEKISQLGKDIMDLVTKTIDAKNIPDVTNAQFALQRVLAELKLWEKMERERQTIKM